MNENKLVCECSAAGVAFSDVYALKMLARELLEKYQRAEECLNAEFSCDDSDDEELEAEVEKYRALIASF